jgi:HlyD family secretion protein
MIATPSSLRRAPAGPANPHPRRLPAWLVPAGVALGFGLLFLILFRDRILPAREVRVAPVLAVAGNSAAPAPAAAASAGIMLFQASGWIEPDPLPIKATALVSGVVDEVHVLEGQQVEKGQPLATLIREDYEIALKSARQTHQMRVAEHAAHLNAVETARHIISVARADADAAAAVVDEAADRFRRLEKLPAGSVPVGDVISSRSNLQKAKAQLAAAHAAVARDHAELRQLESRTDVLNAAANSAAIDIERAELDLTRTRVTAPAAGRVLRLVAVPGQKKMFGMDDPDSATVAILYEPANLQVRVDVALADAAGLQIGQKARIRTNLLPDTVFNGELTRITGEADLQRNTLQAKVRIENPSDQLRPEMLCRVEFLDTPADDGAGRQVIGSLATWVPQAALDGDLVWVCDPDENRVRPRGVQAAGDSRDGHIRILDGLRPGEWVVLDFRELRNGQRVKPMLIKP